MTTAGRAEVTDATPQKQLSAVLEQSPRASGVNPGGETRFAWFESILNDPSSLVDAGAAVQAAEIRLEQIRMREAELLAILERAIESALREFGLSCQKERERRITQNLETLRKLDLDESALNRLEIYRLDRLAPCFKNVTRLDRIFEQIRDLYGAASDRARRLLEVFAELDAELTTK
jgi:hypothetical protein